jgi:alpha-ketoglutarate-dependent taurine dioxygenase
MSTNDIGATTPSSGDVHFDLADIKPKIGTIIRSDKRTLLSGGRSSEIRNLLKRRGVLVFPEIHLTDQEQILFTRTLGKFAHEKGEQREGQEGDHVYPISMDPAINPSADYLRGAFFWHIDGTTSEVPIFASILSARILAKNGGETEFSNTYAAWDDLPENERKIIEGLRVVHTFWRSQLYVHPEPSYEQFKRWLKLPTKTLPLAWTHDSGRKSLILGVTAQRIEGMSVVESEQLLIRLRDWATQPQFTYRHTWTLGDMVIWDNTGTMHRALPYSFDSGRLMHRTKLEGEEPVA